jgi:hypothetical protein
MIEQNTSEWHAERCDKITGSRLTDCMAMEPDKWKVLRASGTTLKLCYSEADAGVALADANAKKPGHLVKFFPGKPLKAWENYQDELLCERLTGEVKMIGEPPAIRWGNDNEDYGLRAYENRTGRMVTPVGFVLAPATTGLVNYGASPDGLVTGGSIEIKCPLVSAYHIACFRFGIPDEHKAQMEGQMIALDTRWVDFVSYDPRFTGDYEHLQLFIHRYESDPVLKAACIKGIINMEAALVQSIASLPGPGEV